MRTKFGTPEQCTGRYNRARLASMCTFASRPNVAHALNNCRQPRIFAQDGGGGRRRSAHTDPSAAMSVAGLANNRTLLHLLLAHPDQWASWGGASRGPFPLSLADWALQTDPANGVITIEHDVNSVCDAVHSVEAKTVLIAAISGRLISRAKEGVLTGDARLRGERLIARILLACTGQEVQDILYLLDRASTTGVVPDAYELVFHALTITRPAVLAHIAVTAQARVADKGCPARTVMTDLDDTLIAMWRDERVPHGSVYPGARAFIRELRMSQHDTRTNMDSYATTQHPHAQLWNTIGWWDVLTDKGQSHRSIGPTAPRASGIRIDGADPFDEPGLQRVQPAPTPRRMVPGMIDKLRTKARAVGRKMVSAAPDGILHKHHVRKARAALHALSDTISTLLTDRNGRKDATKAEQQHGRIWAYGGRARHAFSRALAASPMPHTVQPLFPLHVPQVLLSAARLQVSGTGVASHHDGAGGTFAHTRLSPLIIVTARPAGHRGFLKRVAIQALARMEIPLADHILVLMGSILTASSLSAMARTKYTHISHVHALKPMNELVFVGDSGQGDALTAAWACTAPGSLGSCMKLCLIHDVTSAGRQEGDMHRDLAKVGPLPENVVYFHTYIGACLAAFRAGLLTEAQAVRVAEETVREAIALSHHKGWASAAVGAGLSTGTDGRRGQAGTWQAYVALLQQDIQDLSALVTEVQPLADRLKGA